MKAVELTAFSNNPANGLACARPWRIAVARTLRAAVYHDSAQELLAWALVEGVNFGSHQRAKFPEFPDLELRGTGRWCATDRGGHYRPLRETLLRATEAVARRREWGDEGYHPLVTLNGLLAVLGRPVPNLDFRCGVLEVLDAAIKEMAGDDPAEDDPADQAPWSA